MIDPREARILALERKQARLGQFLEAQRTDIRGVQQQLWDSQAGVAAPAPSARPTVPFSACGCTSFPQDIALADPVFGKVTISYDAGNGWWKGTLSGISYIGGPVGCANKTISITYTYVPCSYLSWDWKRINATGCPDPTGIATNYTDISGGGVICTPYSDSITYFTGTYTPMDKLYGNVNQTFTLS